MRLWIVVSLTVSLLVGWSYVHTDEIPLILGGILALGFGLGFTFPQYWGMSWLILGLPCPIDEVLIKAFDLHAPFEGGHPLNSCVAFFPALIGVAVGRASRRKVN